MVIWRITIYMDEERKSEFLLYQTRFWQKKDSTSYGKVAYLHVYLVIESQFSLFKLRNIWNISQIFGSVTLPPTTALPTQKMLATTTKYKVRTTSKKMDVKTTALELETTTPTSSKGKGFTNNSWIINLLLYNSR